MGIMRKGDSSGSQLDSLVMHSCSLHYFGWVGLNIKIMLKNWVIGIVAESKKKFRHNPYNSIF